MYVKNVMLSVGVICSMAVPVAAQTTVAKAVSVAEVQQQLLLPLFAAAETYVHHGLLLLVFFGPQPPAVNAHDRVIKIDHRFAG